MERDGERDREMLIEVDLLIELVADVERLRERETEMLRDPDDETEIVRDELELLDIDLDKLKPDDLIVDKKTIFINLPKAQITDAYLDEKLTKVIDRKTGLLAPSDKNLEQTVRQNAVDDIRRAAREGGILKAADDRARAQLRNLLLQVGFEKVQFTDEPAPVSGGTSAPPIP